MSNPSNASQRPCLPRTRLVVTIRLSSRAKARLRARAGGLAETKPYQMPVSATSFLAVDRGVNVLYGFAVAHANHTIDRILPFSLESLAD